MLPFLAHITRLLNAVAPNSCKLQTSKMPFKQVCSLLLLLLSLMLRYLFDVLLQSDTCFTTPDATWRLILLTPTMLPSHSLLQPPPPPPLLQMENINAFLQGAEKLGVPKSDLFQTVDLYERKNPLQVLDTIFAFARHASKVKPDLPVLGPRLADKRPVHFSQELLDQGKYIPSQQTGYQAAIQAVQTGATAAGMSCFGAVRQISNANVLTGDPGAVSQQTVRRSRGWRGGGGGGGGIVDQIHLSLTL